MTATVVSRDTTESRRVLVVEQDRSLLARMKDWLARAGYDVVACASYEDGRRQLLATHPAILLTDVQLGAFNGLQLVIWAKTEQPDTRAFVIADDPVLRQEAARQGARCVPRPATAEELLRSLAGNA